MTWREVLQSTPGPQSRGEYLALYAKGVCMGVADLIPGVSGGTIALIAGIYQQLLDAIQSLNRNVFNQIICCRLKEACREMHLRFMLTLGLGVVTAIIAFAKLMHYLLLHQAHYTWSFFFGLVAASILILSRRIEVPYSLVNIASFSSGAVITYLALGWVPVSTPDNLWFIGFCGFIGITAMILPGISGSLLLLMLGKYEFIIQSLTNPFQVQNLIVIATFSTGAFLSLISVSRLLGYLLKRYPDLMTAFLTGLLLGSLRKIWPWKEVAQSLVIRGRERVIQAHNLLPEMSSEVVLAIGVMASGAAAIILIEYVHSKRYY